MKSVVANRTELDHPDTLGDWMKGIIFYQHLDHTINVKRNSLGSPKTKYSFAICINFLLQNLPSYKTTILKHFLITSHLAMAGIL